ncbi:MAG: lipoxygenase family protein [Cyanobacteriota bacterium]|nr:lipoxygenase family protein [Cyanobacteriota bacterium]
MASQVNTKYQWVIPENEKALPFVKGLPKGEGFTPFKIIVFLSTAIFAALGLITAQFFHFIGYTLKQIFTGNFKFQGTADLGLATVYAKLNHWNNLKEFNSFFKPWTFLKRPEVAKTWDTDAEFGRQRLVGMNPAFLKKCRPQDIGTGSKFPVTEELLKAHLGSDFNLTTAFDENRLYLLDYEILQKITLADLENQLGRYPQAPFCLLYLNKNEELVPVAIQLDQNPSSENPIYTPSSPAQEWLTAKSLVASADAAYQGIVSHLVFTHLVIEVFAIATHRHLPKDRVLWQLLNPHYFNTLAINNMARSTFLGRGAFFDSTGALGFTGSNELLSRSYSGKGQIIDYDGDKLEFYKLSLPHSLELRDVKDIPNYYYRDDAQLVWDAIQTYVTDVLKTKYKDASSLANDSALQAWKDDLISEKGGNMKGLLPPEMAGQLTGRLTDINALIFIATNVIFTATAQHSAVNFGQYDYAAWVPNMAFAMYKPLEELVEHNVKDTDSLTEWLPDRIQTLKQIVLVKTLVIRPPWTSKSLKTFKNPFKEREAREVFKSFKSNLNEIEQKIKARNAELKKEGKRPYVYLQPSRIGQSIAI